MTESIIGLIGGLVGVVIGSVISIVTIYMQNRNNINMFVLEKRFKLYEPVIKLYLKASKETSSEIKNNMISDFCFLSPELLLYSSLKVRRQLEKVQDCVLHNRLCVAKGESSSNMFINEMLEFDILLIYMREELNIKS